MLVNNLFGPKWKHRKAPIRKQALLDLDPEVAESQAIFVEVAQNDSEPTLRMLAIKRLEKIEECQHLAASTDQDVANEAIKRLAQLIGGEGKLHMATELRLLALNKLSDNALVEMIARQADDAKIRLSAMQKLDKPSLYGELATTDPSIEVRSYAINCIVKPATLARIVKATRRKDKQINQLAQARLDAISVDKEKPAELINLAKKVCAELTAIVQVCNEQNKWQPSASQVEGLAVEWDAIIKQWQKEMGEWDQNLSEQFNINNEKFQSALLLETEKQQEQIRLRQQQAPIVENLSQICQQLQSLVDVIEQESVDNVLELLSKSFQALKEDKAELDSTYPSLDKLPELQDLRHDYQVKYDKITNEIIVIEKFNRASRATNALLLKTEQLLKAEKLLAKNIVTVTQKRWQKIEFPVQRPQAAIAQQRFDSLISKLQGRLDQQKNQYREDCLQFERVVQELEKSLLEGKAKHAVNVCRRCEKLKAVIINGDNESKPTKNALKKFTELHAEVKSLQDWRKWSNTPVKESMCEDVEALAIEMAEHSQDPSYQVSNSAKQLKDYRAEWQRLASSEGGVDASLMARFELACEKVHGHCQTFFKQREANRQSNLSQRQQYCHDLEQFAEKNNSAELNDDDLNKIEKITRVAQTEWRKLGGVDKVEYKEVSQRFNVAVDNLKALSIKIRQSNGIEKQQLIDKVQLLIDSQAESKITLEEAIERVKKIQPQWKSIGPAQQDKQLWLQFQQVCNQLFNVRKAKNQELVEQRDTLRKQKITVCETVENLASLSDEDMNQAVRKVTDIKAQWQEDRLPVELKSIEKRFTKACQTFESNNRKYKARQQQVILQHQENVALWCLELESLLIAVILGKKAFDEISQDYALLQTQIQSMEFGKDLFFKLLATKLKNIDSIYQTMETAELSKICQEIELVEDERIEQKKSICLMLEILTESESPKEFEAERMKCQVSMLANKMTQGQNTSADNQFNSLQKQWYESGLIINDIRLDLERRYSNASAIFTKSKSNPS